MIQGIFVSLLMVGILAMTAAAQSTKIKYSQSFDKTNNLFKIPALATGGGQIIVENQIRKAARSCYTVTVNAYTPGAKDERVLVQTKSRRGCARFETPRFVLENMPVGLLIIEIVIDKMEKPADKLEAEIEITYPAK